MLNNVGIYQKNLIVVKVDYFLMTMYSAFVRYLGEKKGIPFDSYSKAQICKRLSDTFIFRMA